MGGDRRYVMSKKNPIMFGCPGEKRFIIDCREAGILCSNEVNIGDAAA
jgi:hypothetical protein